MVDAKYSDRRVSHAQTTWAATDQLTDLANNPIANEKGKTIILGDLVINALMTQDRKELDGAAKFARFRLAEKVSRNEDIDVTDAALIKEVCGNVLMPLPLGRIWDLLQHPLHENPLLEKNPEDYLCYVADEQAIPTLDNASQDSLQAEKASKQCQAST